MKDTKQYYEGWYLKHQNNNSTLCLIPGRSSDTAFIQVITNRESFIAEYPLSQYRKTKDSLTIGENTFTKNGVELSVNVAEKELSGEIIYDKLVPIPYDIMGPFALFPMETKHEVISMNHSLQGSVRLNGQAISFDNGKGYWEGDRGTSFPKSYAWVHCNDFPQPCSMMLSIAHIPWGKRFFWGCIGVVWINGKQYRLATYKGVRIIDCTENRMEVSQGRYRLVIDIENASGQKLAAPQHGKMVRIIYENAAVKARFRFYKGDSLLLDYESGKASFEYVP